MCVVVVVVVVWFCTAALPSVALDPVGPEHEGHIVLCTAPSPRCQENNHQQQAVGAKSAMGWFPQGQEAQELGGTPLHLAPCFQVNPTEACGGHPANSVQLAFVGTAAVYLNECWRQGIGGAPAAWCT